MPHTDEVALNGGLGSTETKTNVLVPSPALANLLALRLGIGVKEDVRLLLERTFRLDGQLGRHCCENSVRRGEQSRKFVAKRGVSGPAVDVSLKIYSTGADNIECGW